MRTRKYTMPEQKLQWTPVYAKVCTILLDAETVGLIELGQKDRDFVGLLLANKEITNLERKYLGKISWRTIERRQYNRNSWWKGDLLPKWEGKIRSAVAINDANDAKEIEEESVAIHAETERSMARRKLAETSFHIERVTNAGLLAAYKHTEETGNADELNSMIRKVVRMETQRIKWKNYSFIEEMFEYACNCAYKSIMNFNPEKGTEIWKYLRQLINNSFIQIIQKKKTERLMTENEVAGCGYTGIEAPEVEPDNSEADDMIAKIRGKMEENKVIKKISDRTPNAPVQHLKDSDDEADAILAAIRQRKGEREKTMLSDLKESFESGQYEQWLADCVEDKDAESNFDRAMSIVEK